MSEEQYKLFSAHFILGDDGVLYRRSTGKPPGVNINNGYALVKIQRTNRYRRGRVVLTLKLGRDIHEEMTCDHIDRNRLNDHPDNLREATPREQTENSLGYSHDPNKYVRWEEDRKKWAAFAKKDNKKIRIGRYTTKEQALEARKKYLEENDMRMADKPNH